MPVRYPKEQMHRIKYTKLAPEQISGKRSAVNYPSVMFSNFVELTRFGGELLLRSVRLHQAQR